LETLGTRLWGWYQGQDMLARTADPARALTPVLDTFEAGKEHHYDFIVARQIRDYLHKRDSERPLLLWAGFHTPHPPLHPPKEFAGLYDPAEIDLPDVDPALAATKPPMQRATGKEWKQTPADVRRRMIAAYLALVTHVDDAIGRLLATLDETGILQDALVVFVSDHGEQLGEHDMLGKFNMFYEGSMRVPLVLRLPDGAHAGETRGQLVEHVDLFPTLCAATGLASPRGLAGHDLSPVMENANAPHREHVNAMLVEKGAHRADSVHSGETFVRGCMVRTDRWKLAVYSDGDGELYDLEADPCECANLYRSDEHAAIREDLYRRIIAHQLTHTRNESNAGLNHFPG
jgi:arylsulfatase A-like enzyme